MLIKNVLMLWTWSQERDRNVSKTCVFIFHHSIQHDEASGYIFYKYIGVFRTLSKMETFAKIVTAKSC